MPAVIDPSLDQKRNDGSFDEGLVPRRERQDDEIAETDSDGSNIVFAVSNDAAKKQRKNAMDLIDETPTTARRQLKTVTAAPER